MTTPKTGPQVGTIKALGAPHRALWHGPGRTEPSETGELCTIRAVDGGWVVQVDGMKQWHVPARTRVWLAPLDEQGPAPAPDVEQHVTNPSPVPIRLDTPTMSAYRRLSLALAVAANAADASAAAAAQVGDIDGQRADLTVRDALRRAATEALVPAGPIRAPRCRRCSIACEHCSAAAGDPVVTE